MCSEKIPLFSTAKIELLRSELKNTTDIRSGLCEIEDSGVDIRFSFCK